MIINAACQGVAEFKAAMEGVKFTTGFWRYRPKRLLFEVASRQSRTLGVDQKFLIVKTKEVFKKKNLDLCFG